MRANIVVPIYVFSSEFIHHLYIWKWSYVIKIAFESIIKSFHGSIIIKTASLAHTLCYIIVFTEIYKFTWGKLNSLIWVQNHFRMFFLLRAVFRVFIAKSVLIQSLFNEATADLSYKSIIEQLYLNFPFGCRIYVKSVHHTLFLQSTVNFWFKRLSKILFFLPAL